MGSGGSTLSTSTTLSYLGRQQAGRQSRSHVLRREGGDGSDESKARQRFLRVMNIVRHEANTVEAMNVKDYERRKRMISSEISFEIKRDHEDALAARRAKLAELGLLSEADEEEDADNTGDDGDVRDMFYGMIGYELSSSDDEQCEEVHDMYAPNISSSDENEVTSCERFFSDTCELVKSKLNCEETSRTSECSDGDESYDMPGTELDEVSCRGGRGDENWNDNNTGDNNNSSVANDITAKENCSKSSDGKMVTFDSCEKKENLRHADTVSTACSLSPITSNDDNDGFSMLATFYKNSLELNNLEYVQQKKKQFVLHSIMRQESLEERQTRARHKFEKRKQKTTLDAPPLCANAFLDNDEDFEGRKKVVKEFRAYEQLRRSSEHARENRQRESLNRRLDERKRQLQKLREEREVDEKY
jgi:hypothetical protein